jgi:hypothetical protein
MIGYEAQTIDITNNQSINVSLSPSNSELDPIVVTASRVEERFCVRLSVSKNGYSPSSANSISQLLRWSPKYQILGHGYE